VTPIGPLHRGPGEINSPVSVGGIVVHAGDIIVADLNGVVVVPRDTAEDVVERLQRKRAAEADYTDAVARGDFDNSWVDRILDESGVIVESRDPV
jgi:regulator of RNase E activity RraA